jgi:Cys-rich repeat protein
VTWRAGAFVCALVACVLVACQAQLRLEDDGGAPLFDAGGATEAGVGAGPDDASDGAKIPGCTKDGECGLSTLHCDVVSGGCVACLTDDQCAAGNRHRCDAALHRCVECGVDGDCGAGRVCVPGTRRCATSCQQLSDCVVLGDFCDTTRHICARCTDDSICKADPDTPSCSPVGDCVQCVTDATCPAGKPRCDRTTGSCVQCLGSTDCGTSAPLCSPTPSSCVSGP